MFRLQAIVRKILERQIMLGKTYLAEHNYKQTLVARRGLSLLEILVSSILLALMLVGLANIFVATKRLIFHARSRAVAAEVSKYYLDPLQMRVTEQNFGTLTPTGNCLRMFTQTPLDTTSWPDNTTNTVYAPDYNADGAGGLDIDDIDMNPIAFTAPTSIICRASLKVSWSERTE